MDSLVAFADVHDTVVIRGGATLTVISKGPFAALLPTGPENLVYRAAAGLAALCGRMPGVEIVLTKRIPVAAGLGGGSADAAAVLLGLAELWGVSTSEPRLLELACSLGADVPVCLAGRAARVSGIGNQIETLAKLPDCGLVLVNPGIPLATPAVFAARCGPFSARAELPERLDTPAALAAGLRETGNDLTSAAVALAPAVRDVLEALGRSRGCLLARMSGSGATCFGLYEDVGRAREGAADLAAERPGWWVWASCLVGDVSTVSPY